MSDNIYFLNKIQCMMWLKETGQSVSGTLEELRQRIQKFSLYPNLVKRLRDKAKRNYTFECSLNPLYIPQVTSKWSSDETLYPLVNEETFLNYCSYKKQGNIGQQEKAVRMLQSRKIVSVKSLQDNNVIYVQGMIKKLYGTDIRPAVVLFENITPKRAYCSCPIGSSGLCCHVLALLLYLKHYFETNEKILELSCTQQLQKWHKRSTKGSIPMVPLKNIKPKSAKLKKKYGKLRISPADPNSNNYKRDLNLIVKKLKEQLKKEKPIEIHIYSVLINSKFGIQTSVGQHLHYKYTLKTAFALADHKYCKSQLFDESVIEVENKKIEQIKYYVDNESLIKTGTSTNVNIHQNNSFINLIIFY
jgi:hypothetical protein